jgi:hypothetical protein
MKDRFGFIRRFLAVAGIIAIVVMAAALVTPKTAHALVAALVQITNTTNNPAITQDVSTTASQMVILTCRVLPSGDGSCAVTGTLIQYVVPTGKSLVVTAVDIQNIGGPQNVTLNSDIAGRDIAGLAAYQNISGQLHYAYPSGLFWAPGASVTISSSSLATSVFLYGYLTSN